MRTEDKLLEGNLATVLMAILADGASYGYAIVAEAERRTHGRLQIKQNALYPALHKLENDELIAGEWREVAGRRRRYYRLTPKGKKELEKKLARWREFATTMNAALKHQALPLVSNLREVCCKYAPKLAVMVVGGGLRKGRQVLQENIDLLSGLYEARSQHKRILLMDFSSTEEASYATRG